MIAVCEAFVLAERLGLAADKLFEVSSQSSGQCWSLTSYCPVPGPVPSSPANRDYQAGLHRGDDGQGSAPGAGRGPERRRADAAGRPGAQPYALFANGGHGGLDFSAIIRMIAGDL